MKFSDLEETKAIVPNAFVGLEDKQSELLKPDRKQKGEKDLDLARI